MSFLRSGRRVPTIVACALGAALLGASSALVGLCGPSRGSETTAENMVAVQGFEPLPHRQTR
jgi:hypothetical protein